MRAWIETGKRVNPLYLQRVALRVRAWIETRCMIGPYVTSFVALRVRAWIETINYNVGK